MSFMVPGTGQGQLQGQRAGSAPTPFGFGLMGLGSPQGAAAAAGASGQPMIAPYGAPQVCMPSCMSSLVLLPGLLTRLV
jgi:hypothetical protein